MRVGVTTAPRVRGHRRALGGVGGGGGCGVSGKRSPPIWPETRSRQLGGACGGRRWLGGTVVTAGSRWCAWQGGVTRRSQRERPSTQSRGRGAVGATCCPSGGWFEKYCRGRAHRNDPSVLYCTVHTAEIHPHFHAPGVHFHHLRKDNRYFRCLLLFLLFSCAIMENFGDCQPCSTSPHSGDHWSRDGTPGQDARWGRLALFGQPGTSATGCAMGCGAPLVERKRGRQSRGVALKRAPSADSPCERWVERHGRGEVPHLPFAHMIGNGMGRAACGRKWRPLLPPRRLIFKRGSRHFFMEAGLAAICSALGTAQRWWQRHSRCIGGQCESRGLPLVTPSHPIPWTSALPMEFRPSSHSVAGGIAWMWYPSFPPSTSSLLPLR